MGLPQEAGGLTAGGGSSGSDHTVGKWQGTVLDQGTGQEKTSRFKWGQEDEGVGGGPEGQLREWKGWEGDRTSGGEAGKVTKEVPEARVATIVQLDTIRDPLTSGLLVQGRCGGPLVDWLVDMGASTTLLSVTEWKHMCRWATHRGEGSHGHHYRLGQVYHGSTGGGC